MYRNIIIHDTETTGLVGKILESAHITVEGGKASFTEDLCDPGLSVEPMAAATHGYSDKDVEKKPPFEETESFRQLKEASENRAYYVAHNALFDLEKLADHGIFFPENRVIDTLRVAKHLYGENPLVENLKLQYFRFLLKMEERDDYKEKMNLLKIKEVVPHTALSDVFVLWVFLEYITETHHLSLDDMVALSAKPFISETINFGNAFKKGERFDDILFKPYGNGRSVGWEYVDWALGNMDRIKSDVDLELTLTHHLTKAILSGRVKALKHNQIKKVVSLAMLTTLEGKDADEAEKICGIKRGPLLDRSIESLTQKMKEFRKKRNSNLKKLKEMDAAVDISNINPSEEEAALLEERKSLIKEMDEDSSQAKSNTIKIYLLNSKKKSTK